MLRFVDAKNHFSDTLSVWSQNLVGHKVLVTNPAMLYLGRASFWVDAEGSVPRDDREKGGVSAGIRGGIGLTAGCSASVGMTGEGSVSIGYC
jgi:hypothetical protein